MATPLAVTAPPELIVVGVIILLVFGSAWLPKLARNAGRTKVELEKARNEFEKAKADITEPLRSTTASVKQATDSFKADVSISTDTATSPTTATAGAAEAAAADTEINRAQNETDDGQAT